MGRAISVWMLPSARRVRISGGMISLRSIEFFKRFEDEMGVPCDYRQEGYLILLFDEADLARYRKNVELQTSLGAEVRIVKPDEARAIVPELRVDDIMAAAWGPMDGYASPNDVEFAIHQGTCTFSNLGTSGCVALLESGKPTTKSS